jgi:hypothetical protein
MQRNQLSIHDILFGEPWIILGPQENGRQIVAQIAHKKRHFSVDP